jgi:uncharacterized protein YjeT (DUF2065 family)
LKEAAMLSILIRGIVGFIFVLLGVVGLVSPGTTRRLVSALLAKAPVRVFGAFLMLLGAGAFRAADQLSLPLAGQVLGVALFMAGGVHILIPDFAIILNEWWVAQKTIWERLVSVVYLFLAALFLAPSEGIHVRQWFTPLLPAAYDTPSEDEDDDDPEVTAPEPAPHDTAPTPE